MPLPEPDSLLLEQRLGSLEEPLVRRERRLMFRQLPFGAIPGYAPICLDTNDPHTIACSFKKRLMRNVPTPDSSLLVEFRIFVKSWVRENLPKVQVMEFEQWLESTSYNEARKAELRVAYDELRGGRPSRRAASHVQTFMKTEFYEEYKQGRSINSRKDSVKAFLGPRFKAIEEVLYQNEWFIKHVPVPQRPGRINMLRKTGLRYWVSDFTAFESHFTSEIMNACECELYRWCLEDDVHADFVCDVISGQNVMHSRSGLRASVMARRMSGDMCTSLGNGFTNLMLALFLAHRNHYNISGFVEGDDGIFATDSTLSVDVVMEQYKALGFTILVEEVRDPGLASFCGMICTEDEQILRNPRAFFQGFGWTSSFITAGSTIMHELLRAKALSAVYETPHCPVVGALARKALEVTRAYKPRFVADGYHVLPPDEVALAPFNPTPATRMLFAELYGVSVECQVEAERRISAGDLNVSDLISPGNDVLDYASRFVESRRIV